MACYTGDVVGSDKNTCTKVIECGNEQIMSVPIYREVCQKGGISSKGKQQTDHNRGYCSCDLEVLPSYHGQPNSVGMICAHQRRTNYRRSLSLPGSRKGLYDIVVSEDLLCVGHICNHESLYGAKKMKLEHSLSYEDRDLVKMEIEMELENSVPDELKAVQCGSHDHTKHYFCDTSCKGDSARSKVDVDVDDVQSSTSIAGIDSRVLCKLAFFSSIFVVPLLKKIP